MKNNPVYKRNTSRDPRDPGSRAGNYAACATLFLLAVCLVPGGAARAQSDENPVPQERMQQVYEEIKTPYKYGLILTPPDDSRKMDCPSVFRKDGRWYMSYIVYDGRGYETWLAESDDLLNWETSGRILSFTEGTWDANQKAGYMGLQDHEWGGSYELQTYDDKYWMSYFGGDSEGYEAGLLSIGIAFTGQDPAMAHEWQRPDKPVLKPTDEDARWWENSTMYKNTVIRDKDQTTGYPFVMYYNARGDSINPARGSERIGMAVSEDMINWKRFGEDPVMGLYNRGITGDAVLQKMGDLWVMFYFGAFWEGTEGAFNRFACSYDLVNWTDWQGENLIEPSEDYDELFAHKSFVVKYEGVVYHFYCAVNDKQQRGIAVATSEDLGKSKITFNQEAK